MELSEEEKKNRLYIIGALVAIIALVAVIVIGGIMSGNSTSGQVEDEATDHGISDDAASEPYILFDNRYQLEYSTSKDSANRVFYELGKIITSASEIATAPRGNTKGMEYTGTLVESSFREYRAEPKCSFGFRVEVSDGRAYQVRVRTDQYHGVYYDAVLASQDNAQNAYLLVSINVRDTDDFKREAIIQELSAWAKSVLPGKEISLTVKDNF